MKSFMAIAVLVALVSSGCIWLPQKRVEVVTMPEVSNIEVVNTSPPKYCPDRETVIAMLELGRDGKTVDYVAFYVAKLTQQEEWKFDAFHPMVLFEKWTKNKSGMRIYVDATWPEGKVVKQYPDLKSFVKVWGDDPCVTYEYIRQGRNR